MSHQLSDADREMLFRGRQMGPQGFYAGRVHDRRVCESLRRKGLLRFKDRQRARGGHLQFYTATARGRAA